MWRKDGASVMSKQRLDAPRLFIASDNTNADRGFATKGTVSAEKVVDHEEQFQRTLRRILKNKVIPQIYAASSSNEVTSGALRSRLSDEEFEIFRQLILNGEHEDCLDFVQAKIDKGVPLRKICLGLFTLAAQDLGERWLSDELSFAEVTMGLGKLHILVHRLSSGDNKTPGEGPVHNIILASSPSEQHAFGILVVSKIFELDGWFVSGGPDLRTGDELTKIVEKTWFDIIGLTASTEELAYGLTEEIRGLRACSVNPDVFVMVGGNGFANRPAIWREIGADEMASDAEDAMAKAQKLLDRRTGG